MRNFHDILFISKGLKEESEDMRQALGLARNNNAPLKILVVCPEFPKKLARTGISGFFPGNTAENILQKIGCSLLALKPQGFVSPGQGVLSDG